MNNSIINYSFLDDLVEVKHRESKFFVIRNFFTEEGILEAQNMIKIFGRDEELWETIPTEKNSSRKRLKACKHLFIYRLNAAFSSERLRTAFKQAFDLDIETANTTFWKDLPGYDLDMHVDNIEHIDASVQIYVTDNIISNLGTAFGYEDYSPFLTLPYRNNFGYVSKTANRMTHGVINTVPEGVERYSIYINLKEKIKNG